MLKAFFAYDSQSANAAESIRECSRYLLSSHLLEVLPWESYRRPGRVIIDELLEAIRDCDVFCADCSTLNANVLFELGYAIARQKPILITVDQSSAVAVRRYQDFPLLSPISYLSSETDASLMEAFAVEEYFSNTDPTLFVKQIQPHLQHSAEEALLYLKPRAETNAIRRIGRYLDDGDIHVRVDDPKEALQTLGWYTREVFNCVGVLCHFVSADLDGADQTNPRYGLVAGLAVGLDRPVMMLANQGYQVPFDYKTLLTFYKDANQAQEAVSKWYGPLSEKRKAILQQRTDSKAKMSSTTAVRSLYLGQVVAELEANELVDQYFIETAPYRDARDGRCNIFIGRRGVGKTAMLIKLRHDLIEDPKNFVCLIQPGSYELSGLVRLIADYGGIDTSAYALQSLWKYLLLTELASQLGKQISAREPYSWSRSESVLMEYLGSHDRLLRGDFATRLEDAVHDLETRPRANEPLLDWRAQISQRLHSGVIKDLNDAMRGVLNEKLRVAVLIDNLDRAWDADADLEQLAQFVVALLSVANDLHNLFDGKTLAETTCDLSLTLFLRSDIWHRVRQKSRERDKIKYRKVEWTDRELLVRVVEERYAVATQGKESGSSLWTNLFVDAPDAKRQILSYVYPRPRDLLFCTQTALEIAADRNESKVRKEDLDEALRRYSRFALDSIQSESKVLNLDLDAIAIQFIGSNYLLRTSEVAKFLREAGVEQERSVSVTRELCLVGFLGLVTGEQRYEFIDDVDEYNRIRQLANVYAAKRRDKEVLYILRPAFWSFLETRLPKGS